MPKESYAQQPCNRGHEENAVDAGEYARGPTGLQVAYAPDNGFRIMMALAPF